MNFKIKIILIPCMLIISTLFSQTTQESEGQAIAVPDVSTAIDGAASEIDKNAIPDFTVILPEVETDYLLTLNLPEETIISSNDSLDSLTGNAGSTFSLEGIVGGGYPGYFLGDIKVIQNSEKSPFNIHFSHLSQNGFGSHLPSDGYTQNETFLFGDTRFVINDTYSLYLAAQYETGSDGLQNKSPLFYLSALQDVETSVQFEITTPSQWNIDLTASGLWMNRYLGNKASTSLPQTLTSTGIGGAFGFAFGKNFSKLSFLTTSEYAYFSLDESTSHRINANLFMNIPIFENMDFDTLVGIVYEKNLSVPVLVPFSLSFDYTSTLLQATFAGGMNSNQIDYDDIQKKYPYTHIAQGIHENAAWFSKMGIQFPIVNTLSLAAEAEFEKTAFGQGYLLPNYAQENAETGLYDLTVQDVLLLDTNIELETSVGMFGFLAGWSASWIDVLPEENAQEIYVKTSVTPDDSLWGVQLSIEEAFSGDYVPNIALSGFVSLSPAFQIELKVEDFVKLVSSTDRIYAGKYVTNSGFVGLFARLYL